MNRLEDLSLWIEVAVIIVVGAVLLLLISRAEESRVPLDFFGESGKVSPFEGAARPRRDRAHRQG